MVLLALRNESQVQNSSAPPGGILKPEMSLMEDTGRIFGIVLAVGDPLRLMKHGRLMDADELPPPELEFGDLVEITRWAEGPLFSRWGVWSLFDEPGAEAFRDFAPEDGGPETYRLTNRHAVCIMDPQHVICRWARRDWVFRRQGEPPRPTPIGDRVILKNVKAPEKSAGGIILPHWMRRDEPLGEVVACGAYVQNLMPGDWALMRSDKGTAIRDKAGQTFTVLHQREIIGRWDEEPDESVKLAYSAELTGGVK